MASNVVLVEGLVKKYGTYEALKGLSFTSNTELVILAGPNGAGKTTTVEILTTNLRPDSGRAEVMGYDVVNEYKAVRRVIAYLPQDYFVFGDLTPKEYVASYLMARGSSFWEAWRLAGEWLEAVGLSGVNRPMRQLSGGQMRRTYLAAMLATDAEVLFLDEPTAGIDVEARRDIWRLLREKVRSGTCILTTTHDMSEAETIADKVVILNEGRMLYEGPPRALVEKVGFSHKAVLSKEARVELKRYVDLGDRVIAYFSGKGEFEGLVSLLDDPRHLISVGTVDLEDAYLLLVRGELR